MMASGSRRITPRQRGGTGSPPSAISPRCPAGTRVRVTGLATAAHLNGRLGTTVQPTKPLKLAASRIAVRIDGRRSEQECVAHYGPTCNMFSACGTRTTVSHEQHTVSRKSLCLCQCVPHPSFPFRGGSPFIQVDKRTMKTVTHYYHGPYQEPIKRLLRRLLLDR